MSKATENFVQKCKGLFTEAAGADAVLSVAEMRTLIVKLCGNNSLTDRMIADIFCDMDVDGDKMLSWEEFSACCLKRDPKSVQENELRELFKKMDKNNDGMLNPSEVREAFEKLKIKSDPEQSLKECDADHDGKVSVDEFFKYWNKCHC